MARQVLNAVFPLLKAEWALSDAQLGLLSGVVAIMVGLLTFPLSLLADRWGRVKSLTAMAVLWSLATLLCAVADNYQQMLAGRILVGVGEAAYGSVGIAVVVSVFPKRLRATLSAAFMAGGLLGQVLGVGIGGAVAAAMAGAWPSWSLPCPGLAHGGPLSAPDRRAADRDIAGAGAATASTNAGSPSRSSAACSPAAPSNASISAAGCSCSSRGALPAWLPTYFNRYYDLPVGKAGTLAALFLAICGVGMVVCGVVSDRLFQPARTESDAGGRLQPGLRRAAQRGTVAFRPAPAQLVLLGLAIFLAAATTGPAGAMVADLTPAAIHGTAFATLTLANNFLGLAPGPIVTGWLADQVGLLEALRWLPLASIAAALVFLCARQSSRAEVAFAE